MDSTTTGRPCVCILWRSGASCPVSAAWHSSLAADWLNYYCYTQASSWYGLRCLEATLNSNKQTQKANSFFLKPLTRNHSYNYHGLLRLMKTVKSSWFVTNWIVTTTVPLGTFITFTKQLIDSYISNSIVSICEYIQLFQGMCLLMSFKNW